MFLGILMLAIHPNISSLTAAREKKKASNRNKNSVFKRNLKILTGTKQFKMIPIKSTIFSRFYRKAMPSLGLG